MVARPILASALSLSRNDAATLFPHAADQAALEEVRDRVAGVLAERGTGREWSVYELESMSSARRAHLVERGLMTPGFASASGHGRGFAVYDDGAASVEINGSDHLQVLATRAGDQLSELWDTVSQLDDELESAMEYAYDPRWGYLSARPSHAGSGLRAYTTLMLPALMVTGRLASLALELIPQGFSLTPLWGGAGGLLQVSNHGLQGKPESELIESIGDVSRGVMEKERSIRKMLLRERPTQVRDHIGRALGVAQHAWSVTLPEAVSLACAVQAGVEMGMVETPRLAQGSFFTLIRRLQPGHLVLDMDAAPDSLEGPAVDEARARVLRSVFAEAAVRE